MTEYTADDRAVNGLQLLKKLSASGWFGMGTCTPIVKFGKPGLRRGPEVGFDEEAGDGVGLDVVIFIVVWIERPFVFIHW